jgi:hypothetical protein
MDHLTKKKTAKEMAAVQAQYDERQIEKHFDFIYSCINNHALSVKAPAKTTINVIENQHTAEALKRIEALGYKVTREDPRNVLVSW